MALSGNIDYKFTGRTYRISWSGVQDVANNQTTITCTHYLINDAAYSLYIGARNNTCTVDGTAVAFTSPSISTSGGQTHNLGTTTHVVTHASDGTKSVAITGVFNIQATLSGSYVSSVTASATVTLDTIPRASTLTADSSVNMGSSLAITINRASTAFTHTITYTFGSTSGTIISKTTGTSVSWTPSLELARQIPNATSGTCTLTCQTYSGSTLLGSSTKTVTMNVPTTIVPTIGSFTDSKVNGTVPSSWNLYVQGKSKCLLTISGAEGSYGSTIVSYSISGGGFVGAASTLTTGLLNTSDNITFTAKVTDSRGRSSNAMTLTIYVTPYSSPTFTSYSANRCTSTEVLSDSGTYVQGKATFSYSVMAKNTVTTAVYYKRNTASDWNSASTSFSSGTSFVFGSGLISSEYSYDIRFDLTDAFSTVSVTMSLSTAAVLMDFKSGGKGLAIGKVCEDTGFDVNFASHFRSTVIFDDVVNIDSMLNLTSTATVKGLALPGYGTCSSSASSSIKYVTCDSFTLKPGVICTILMTYGNTYTLPRLNIGYTGSYYLSYGGVQAASGSTKWLAGSVLTVMFTGTYYEVLSMDGSWTPTIAGTSTYNYQDGYFHYSGGVLSFGFAVNGKFTSTTTSSTNLAIAGLPFTNASTGLASGGGVAFGCYSTVAAFFGWVVASGDSNITGRTCGLSSSNTYTASYVNNYPSATYNITGSITMRVI